MTTESNNTVVLSRPLKVADGEVTILTFREAELGDMIAADAVVGEMAKTSAVLASMCGVPLQAFRKITMADMNAILKKVGHLLGNDPAPAVTGA